jgi:hydroxymethylpyrimidine/phosphomethylpyrimidine kinase
MHKKNLLFHPASLTIAGSDSGGGAGIQADLRTFFAFNLFACSVITAVTSQNPFEVKRIDPIPAAGVAEQLNAVLSAFPVKAAKTGMLFNHAIINAVSIALASKKIPLVIDPVMISTSGSKLLKDKAIEALKQKLFPLASWITPNIPEAEALLDRKIKGPDDMAEGVWDISRKYSCGCVLKGGHSENKKAATDFVAFKDKIYILSSPLVKVAPLATHGTGCTFSAALTAGIALGFEWQRALAVAKAYVYSSLSETIRINKKLNSMFIPGETRIDKITFELYK